MVNLGLVYKHIPKVFGTLAFIVNPVFIYLIFTEKSTKFGNYRYVLSYFATFNLVFSVANVVVPIDIHSHRYCFYVFISDGLFVEQSDRHLQILSLRCALVGSSYAVLLSHFIYRYLVIHNSVFTRSKFHIYVMISFGILLGYTSAWYFICYLIGSANREVKEYINESFAELYGIDSMDRNMISSLYNEESDRTLLRGWSSTILWTTISAISIGVFLKLAHMLLRALIVQTVVPIFVSFFPCVISFIIPIFNLDLGRSINYVEVIALGAFPFWDPVAIVMCLPIFRKRVLCQKSGEEKVRSKKKASNTLPKFSETS